MGTNDLLKKYNEHYNASKQQSLNKFTQEQYELLGRPPVLAVDAYQWIFQIQRADGSWKAQGQWNQEACFKRLMNMRLSLFETLGVELVMVLDGYNKPTMKRDQLQQYTSGPDSRWVTYLIDMCSHREIACVQAAGEGEAECARLQIEGKVDWVFSNDSDCLLFGANQVVYFTDPSASSPGASSSHQRSVTAVKVDKLSRANFILYGLLKGGDYDTKGVGHFGSSIAFEVACNSRFGDEFGQLLDIRDFGKMAGNGRSTPEHSPTRLLTTRCLSEWRNKLNYQLQTNEENLFSRRNPACQVDESFPDQRVLKWYTHPVVNRQTTFRVKRTVPDLTRLYAYFKANLPYTYGWDSYREFCNQLSASVLVRRVLYSNEVPDMYRIVREINGQREGCMKLLVDVDKVMEPITAPGQKPTRSKLPTNERDVWRYILERGDTTKLVAFDEAKYEKAREKQEKKTKNPPVAAARKTSSKKGLAPTNNKQLSDFFLPKEKAPSLSRKPSVAKSASTVGARVSKRGSGSENSRITTFFHTVDLTQEDDLTDVDDDQNGNENENEKEEEEEDDPIVVKYPFNHAIPEEGSDVEISGFNKHKFTVVPMVVKSPPQVTRKSFITDYVDYQ